MFNNDDKTDNYITNKNGWESIKQFIPTNKKIYSPFYCDGSMETFFKEMGYNIIHNDMYYYCVCVLHRCSHHAYVYENVWHTRQTMTVLFIAPRWIYSGSST